MKLIVISPSKNAANEIKIVNELFEHGLETFHLRKPSMSTKEMKKYIESIPAHFYNRIIIHSHHKLAGKYSLKGIHLTKKHAKKKFRTWLRLRLLKIKNPHLIVTTSYHRLASVYEQNKKYNYVFLGTIFDQLSNKFNAGYNETSLRAALSKAELPVIARGGTNAEKIKECNDLGFSGMAFYSGIWKKENPVEEFSAIVNKCRELGIKVE